MSNTGAGDGGAVDGGGVVDEDGASVPVVRGVELGSVSEEGGVVSNEGGDVPSVIKVPSNKSVVAISLTGPLVVAASLTDPLVTA